MYETLIKQYGKKPNIDYTHYFYSFIYSLLNNLIDTNIDKNLKQIFTFYLLTEKTLIGFKNDNGDFQLGRLSRMITRDENMLPIDVSIRTLDNKTVYNRLKGEYVILYNPLPIEYIGMKIDAIGKVEQVINVRRKTYKAPIIYSSKDAKVIKAIKEFINNLFNSDEPITIVNGNTFKSDEEILKTLKLDIEYITDKLLEENEALKEDILEVLGIYKNTSSNRERVNESELIVSNSLTTVNKLGFEENLKTFITEVNEKFDTNYTIDLNINKIFDNFGKTEEGDK